MAKRMVVKFSSAGSKPWVQGEEIPGEGASEAQKEEYELNKDRWLELGAIGEADDAAGEGTGEVSEEKQEIAEAQAKALGVAVEQAPVLNTGSTAPGVGTTPGAEDDDEDDEEAAQAAKPVADQAQESVQGTPKAGDAGKGKGK